LPWIRGEALKTLLALRPLQVGDKVGVTPDNRHYSWAIGEEREVTIVKIERDLSFHGLCPCEACVQTRTKTNNPQTGTNAFLVSVVTAWWSPEAADVDKG
jgi:hypothetical protein